MHARNMLCALPSPPQRAELRDAYEVLRRSSESAQSFFDAFGKVRTSRKAKGTPTDHEQDLLRASLIFAAAGLDSMAKQLVRDCLRLVMQKEVGAQAQFVEYVQSKLQRQGVIDAKLLARTLLANDPRVHLLDELISDLTANSLQSKDQLLRVAAYFAIRAEEITDEA